TLGRLAIFPIWKTGSTRLKIKGEAQVPFDLSRGSFYLDCGNLFREVSRFLVNMGSFGQELRLLRMNRGIGLRKITEVTKISQRHLVALEEEQFRVLPGGILNKGIVRGYVRVLGLDEMDWIGRFQRAYAASGELLDDDRDWIEFAANVGRARVRPRDAATERLKWAGALLLLLAVALAGFFAVRYYGYRSGWWQT